MSRTVDVAVIGAGAIGTAVAYYCSKAGASVVLIDSGDIAEGTSSKCDGNILVCDKKPGFDAQLARASLDMFDSLSRELEYPIQWSQKGSLYLIETEEELEIARKFCLDMQACGIPMRMLDRKEIKEDEPYLADDLVGGLETACDGALFPIGLCYAYAFGAKKLGVEIKLYSPVTGIEQKAAREFTVRFGDDSLTAKNVVNCAGVWSPAIGKMVGLDIPVKPRQGQILVGEQTFQIGRRKVHEFGYLAAKFQTGGYKRPVSERVERNGVAFVFEPTESNNFLIGSSRRFAGEDISNDIDVMQALAERAVRFFPVLRDIKIIRAYTGIRPFTPDHMPIVSDTEIPGFYIAAGHEGDGIGLSAISGKFISDMIAGNELPMDIAPLRFSRFDQHSVNEPQ